MIVQEELKVPDELDFSISFEDTRVEDKKYLINDNTGGALDVVGHSLAKGCVSHPEFYHKVFNAITENLSDEDKEGMFTKFRSAQKGCWSTMEVHFPSVKSEIENDKFKTSTFLRGISTHGINGCLSNQFFWGLMDMFCTNGQISGEWESVRRKNTSGFRILNFVDEIRSAKEQFVKTTERLQKWANTHVETDSVETVLNKLMSENKAEKMLFLFKQEATVRGQNMFALQSAFTNYSSYADDRNGFNLRQTATVGQTANKSMWSREMEVSKWLSSNEIQGLAS